MEISKTIYVTDRAEWRNWLETHFMKEKEIWLIYPKQATGKSKILYNDAVEEALCFGWIDSTLKTVDAEHTAQRFSPRKPKSSFSQPNIERLHWLMKENLVHESLKKEISEVLKQEFIFPADIMATLQNQTSVWENYQKFSVSYQRIRIAYIEAARNRTEEFEKRLTNFMQKTAKNKLVLGFGGVEKYY